MFKSIISISVLGLSMGSWANTPDFSVFSQKTTLECPRHGHGQDPRNKVHECMKNSWVAAAPSDEQNKQARDFMIEARTAIESHKEAIHSGIQNIFAAWSKYPISKEEVVAAEAAVQPEFAAVKDAVQDARIGVLNLLTQDQRTTFDQTFTACIKN